LQENGFRLESVRFLVYPVGWKKKEYTEEDAERERLGLQRLGF
jgi:hypothetical protein